MNRGAAERKNFAGMVRGCARCPTEIIVTEQMCKRRKYVCRPCQLIEMKSWIKRNRQKKRDANNAYYSRISSKRAPQSRAYRERYPLKALARQAVQTAIRNGSIARQACERCGDLKSHAHHEDYARPLQVVWLCHTHHMEQHLSSSARSEKDLG